MDNEHQSKRRKVNPVDVMAALSVLLDWLDQFPNQSTCHIILVSPELRFSSNAYSPKDRRKPRMCKQDVNLSNLDWFTSFPGKCIHSFTVAAAQNGDLEFLKACVTTDYISKEMINTVLEAAMKHDSLALLCWLRRYSPDQSSEELELAIAYGATKILSFLWTPTTSSNITMHMVLSNVHLEVFEWLKEHQPKTFLDWKTKPKFMSFAVRNKNLALLRYLHKEKFEASSKLYSIALMVGHAEIMDWIYNNITDEQTISIHPIHQKTVAKTFRQHYPEKWSNCLEGYWNGSQLYWYALKQGFVITPFGLGTLVFSNYWERIRFRPLSVQKSFNVFDLHAKGGYFTVEKLQYLLNCGLELHETLFDYAVGNCSLDVCKFLWAKHNATCKPKWPAKINNLFQDNPTKWEWLETIIPFESNHTKETFARTACLYECIPSFKWIISRIPQGNLPSVLERVSDNLDCVIALHEYYPRFPWLKSYFWSSRQQIEFLASCEGKHSTSDTFSLSWPDDFDFFVRNKDKFQWSPQKGKKCIEQFSQIWSEENFQHWLRFPFIHRVGCEH